MTDQRQYRGLTKEGKWVKGDLVRSSDGRFAIIPPMKIFPDLLWKKITMQSVVEVIPETVSHSTGIKDRDGKEIFEGDRFEWDDYCVPKGTDSRKEGVICWDSRSARFEGWINGGKVIGTVHDHLLAKGEK